MVDTIARTPISEIPEGRELSPLLSFDWERDYGTIYRKCPSAFWLAPDGTEWPPRTQFGYLLPPVEAPIQEVEPQRPSKQVVTGRTNAICMACFLAGPIFMVWLGVAIGIAEPAQWQTALTIATLGALMTSPFSIPIGAILGFVPVLLGVLSLGEMGTGDLTMRKPWVWTAVGSAMGAAIAAIFASAGVPGAIAIVATSAACARIARHYVTWGEA